MRRRVPRRTPTAVRFIPFPAQARPATGIAVSGCLALHLDPPPRGTARAGPPLGLVRPNDAAANDGVTVAAYRFGRLLFEVLAGVRPFHHLAGRTTPQVYEGLARRMINLGRAPRLLRPRVCEPAPGVAEVCALARFGDEVRAIAFRLERFGDHWRCTAVETTTAPGQ